MVILHYITVTLQFLLFIVTLRLLYFMVTLRYFTVTFPPDHSHADVQYKISLSLSLEGYCFIINDYSRSLSGLLIVYWVLRSPHLFINTKLNAS